jgi:hypothetical protein
MVRERECHRLHETALKQKQTSASFSQIYYVTDCTENGDGNRRTEEKQENFSQNSRYPEYEAKTLNH